MIQTGMDPDEAMAIILPAFRRFFGLFWFRHSKAEPPCSSFSPIAETLCDEWTKRDPIQCFWHACGFTYFPNTNLWSTVGFFVTCLPCIEAWENDQTLSPESVSSSNLASFGQETAATLLIHPLLVGVAGIPSPFGALWSEFRAKLGELTTDEEEETDQTVWCEQLDAHNEQPGIAGNWGIPGIAGNWGE